MQHHAYLYEGHASLFGQLADDACERFQFVREHNPDVICEQWEKFGIEEARLLSQQAALKSTGGRSLFVLGISSITSEAQQALLKLFEEPRAGAIFVLLVPHGTLLPTLRSRFLEYGGVLEAVKAGNDAQEFLKAPYAKRSAWVTAFLKDDDDARERARVFLGELEQELHKKGMDKKEVRDGLADIVHFRQYVADRAPSLKMILEHFAATLPTLK